MGAPDDDDQGPSSGAAYAFDLLPMSSNVAQISLSTGGVQPLEIDAGPLNAGWTYLALGSISGTSPGISLAGGLILPMNSDVYLEYILTIPKNDPPISNSLGVLSAAGHASAAFSLPPPVFPLRLRI